MGRYPTELNRWTPQVNPRLRLSSSLRRFDTRKNVVGLRPRYWPCGFLRDLIQPNNPIDRLSSLKRKKAVFYCALVLNHQLPFWGVTHEKTASCCQVVQHSTPPILHNIFSLSSAPLSEPVTIPECRIFQ
jgi:hypothetical protein